MKSIKVLIIITSTVFFTLPLKAQKKVEKDSIKVYGNCIMCKRRIEASLFDTKGIKAVDWNVHTKNMFVAYRSDKISKEEIHKIVAKVGHDTEQAKAPDSVYTELPFCCLYRDHDPHTDENRSKH